MIEYLKGVLGLSGAEDADTSSLFDLRLSLLGEVACLHNHLLLRKFALAHDLHEASLHHINDGCLGSVLCIVLPRLLRHERPQTFDVDGWAYLLTLDEVEVAHADLAKVTRVVFVEVDAVVMLTTRI